MSRRAYWFLITIILLTAAFLRLWQIHEYPPGPHYDEAAEVLITRSIAFGGANHFPIVESYQGREALFYYLNAPLFHLIHDGVFTLQISNVFLSLLTIAGTIALGRAMFAGRRGRIIGLTAGVLMLWSFPLLLLARQAFRTPALPLMQTLALLCLWHGLRRGRYGWLIAGGFFGGAALYTYMASRLFPLWLLIGGLLLILLDAGQRRLRLRQGVVFFGVLALTAAPMVIYAIQKPDIFLGRLYEVTQPGESVSLLESIRLHLRMFFVQGEILLRYNIPGRPYFTWPEGLLLIVGMVVAGSRLLRGRSGALERTAYGLALLSPLMILPSVISVGGFPPNHMRAIGMVPLVFVLIGVGVDWVVFYLTTRRKAFGGVLGSPSPFYGEGLGVRYALMLATLTTLLGGVLIGRTYFDWAARADLFYDADGDLVAATRWISQHIEPDKRIYIASQHGEHPTVLIANLPDVTWLGADTLFRPPPGREGVVIWPHSAPPPPESWLNWLEPATIPDIPPGPDGRPAFAAYHVAGWYSLPDGYVLSDAKNAILALHGYQAKPIFPGASGEVLFSWRIDPAPIYPDLMSIVQVEDDTGHVLSRAETPFAQSNRWQPGEEVMYRAVITIPPGTPPGDYALRMTWVARASDQYLPFADGAVWAQVGQVEVLRPVSFPTPQELGIDTSRSVVMPPGARLLNWHIDHSGSLRPGEDLPLTLNWQGEGTGTDVTLEALLWSANGAVVSLWRGQPTHGQYPSSMWRVGEIVVDHALWPIPREQGAGSYRLLLYAADTVVELGTIEIAGIPRVFAAPPVGTRLETGLGDALELYGVNEVLCVRGQQAAPLSQGGDCIQVELIWHAQAEVDTDYTVFVHVLDASGNIVAQRDAMPLDNTYPTSLWAAGEYITDTHSFTNLSPGTYRLHVGLYDQANGQRLPVESSGDFIDLGTIQIDPS